MVELIALLVVGTACGAATAFAGGRAIHGIVFAFLVVAVLTAFFVGGVAVIGGVNILPNIFPALLLGGLAMCLAYAVTFLAAKFIHRGISPQGGADAT